METLKLARNYLGHSQKEFAQWLGVSQGTISNIEKNISPLSDEIIFVLKKYFGDNFFNQRMSTPNLKVHYRASATIAKKYTDLFESRLQIISNSITELLELVEINTNNIPKIDPEDFNLDIETIANEVRDFFDLGRNPINNLVDLLERNGVIVYFFEYDFITSQNKNFDGVSFYVAGTPVILINRKIQGARKMFTLAHELGHLIMHNHNDIFIPSFRDIENEANKFASEFLAPKKSLIGEFSYLTIEKLFALKSYWKISVGALLYKAKEMNLSQDQYRRWVTKLAPYRKFEPNDFRVEEPSMLKKMFEVSKENYNNEKEFLNSFGLSVEIYNEVFSTLMDSKENKLRIV
jgi:Zn-dependent peptidase ImmA (M78 family)/DNA-binding XRE family transcriptional regulator